MSIQPNGVPQGELVAALNRISGKIHLPTEAFAVVSGAAYAAVGSTTTRAIAFDNTADEAATANIIIPDDFDGSAAATMTVYWSSTGTSAAATVDWAVSFLGRAEGEDVGATHVTAHTTDTDSATADALVATEITLVADSFAIGDVVGLQLSRDVSEDDLATDAHFQAAVISYTRTPAISE